MLWTLGAAPGKTGTLDEELVGAAELPPGTEPDAEPAIEELPVPEGMTDCEVGELEKPLEGVSRPVGLAEAAVDVIGAVSDAEPVSTGGVVSAGAVVTLGAAEVVTEAPPTGGRETG